MFRLLTADLRCLANLVRHREGRRLLLSAGISVAFLVFVADLFGRVVALSPELSSIEAGPDGLSALLGTVLLPSLMMTLWFGFGGGSRQLFELPHLESLLKAPVRAPWILVATWLRFGGIVSLWCTALIAPTAARIGDALGVALGWPSAAAASIAFVLPTLAALLVFQVLLQRFFAGRWSRFLLTALSTFGSVAFSLLLIVGALAQEDAVRTMFSMARGQALWPFLLAAPARLWAELATGAPAPITLARVAGILVGAAALVAGAGLLYRRAYENARGSVEPLLRWGRGRVWGGSAAGVLFRKELAQILHQPTQLVGVLFSAVVVVVLAGSRFLGGSLLVDAGLTEAERTTVMMLALWLFAQLTVAPGCLLRLVAQDATQWPLFVGAPLRNSAFLAGKLGIVALLQAWPAAIAAVVGAARFRAEPSTIGAFALIMPACLLWTTAATAFVGTIPPLMRPGPERNNLLALVAVALLLFSLQATVLPGFYAVSLLVQRAHGEGPLAGLDQTTTHAVLIAGAWALALVFGGLALCASALQLRRLRRPER